MTNSLHVQLKLHLTLGEVFMIRSRAEREMHHIAITERNQERTCSEISMPSVDTVFSKEGDVIDDLKVQ